MTDIMYTYTRDIFLLLVLLHGHAEPYNTLYCNTANTISCI